MIRSFIELKISDNIKSELYSYALDIKQELDPYLNTRISSQEDLHITAKFFGNVPDDRLAEMSSCLEIIRCAPFSIKINGINYFMNHKRISVVFAEVEKSEKLLNLKSKIDSALLKFGFLPDENFSPHVTLLRINKYNLSLNDKNLLNINEKVTKIIRKFRMKKSIINLDSFYLMRTDFTEHKAMHSVIKKFKLN